MTSMAVRAIGMTTSLGLDSVDACAAARAGLARLTEITTVNVAIDPVLAKEGVDGVPPFVVHAVPVVGAGCAGLAKLLALAKPALEELVRSARAAGCRIGRTGLCLNLSDAYFQRAWGEPAEPLDEGPPPAYAEGWAETVARAPERLCRELGVDVPPHARVAVAGGHCGAVDVLRHAAELMRQGVVDSCIVGGVESCLEPDALQAYAAAGVVKTASNPAGFQPGEAAAFVLLEPAPAERGPGAVPRITALAEANDLPYLQAGAAPCGRGIAESVSSALARRPGGQRLPPLILADLNGAEQRAADWGHALVQLRDRFGEPEADVWLPALSFGETGAAAGMLALCMAARARERGYAPAGDAMVVLASEDGRRAAILVES